MNSVTKQPHKHAALIKAWADGAEIEYLSMDEVWYEVDTPLWDVTHTYRIKPEPKPDIKLFTTLDAIGTHNTSFCRESYHNVCHVHDGETGKLKAVELIK